jgi:redox-sensitive bicupin YhaK (pirin superfamily)
MSWTKFLAILFICAFCFQIIYFTELGQPKIVEEKEFPEIQKEKIQNSILLKKLILKKENNLKKVFLSKNQDKDTSNLLKNRKDMLPFVGFKLVQNSDQIQKISNKHRNINVLNIILKGEMRISNGGKDKILKEGEVQFYTVGTLPPQIDNSRNEEFKAIQIFIKKLKRNQKSNPTIIKNSKSVNFIGGSIRVIAGAISHENGRIISPIYSDNSVRILEVKLNKNSIFTKKIKSFYNSFIYVIEGEIEVDQKKIRKGFVSLLTSEGNSLQLTSVTDGTMFYLCTGISK